MRLTKIYTKVGDQGSTMLAGGTKVPKDSLRIETYGTVDELNSFLGCLRDSLTTTAAANSTLFQDLIGQLATIQNEMHDLGGELSTPHEQLDISKQQVVGTAAIERLEHEMDAHNETLAPLANFVIPGGHPCNSLAHVCRTVCRRTERLVVALAREAQIRTEPRIYLNRLSDWLFIASRVVSQRLGAPEVLWRQAGKTR